ncbi:MAG: taurine dioxygenase [Sphingomicrobium sp.]
MTTSFATRPLSNRIGVEIDADFSKPLSSGQCKQLRELVHTRGLVVARDQTLDRDAHVRLVKYLGPVPRSGQDGVSVIDNEISADAGKFAVAFARGSLAFHSDDAFSPDPTRYISLHALEIVDGASTTRFAGAATVLGDLPPDLLSQIEGLEAMHVFGRYVEQRNRLRSSETNDPHSVHPLIWVHPVTSTPILYANYLMTDFLYGPSLAESDALLERLFGYLYAPVNLYEHVWRSGDLLLWDNFLLQHARGAVDPTRTGRRRLQRVISVRHGFFEAHPQFRHEMQAGS